MSAAPVAASYADGWRIRAQVAETRRSELLATNRDRFRAVMSVLRKQYPFGRAWLFGSRADGRNGANSDWDVGVEGLPRESWHPLLLALEREFGADRVDLVRVEDVGEALLARIYAGVVLDA